MEMSCTVVGHLIIWKILSFVTTTPLLENAVSMSSFSQPVQSPTMVRITLFLSHIYLDAESYKRCLVPRYLARRPPLEYT